MYRGPQPRRWRFAFIAVGALPFALTTCGGGGGGSPTDTSDDVASVSVSPGEATLVPQQTFGLTATPRNSTGSALQGKAVTWSSNPAGIVSVSLELLPSGAVERSR